MCGLKWARDLLDETSKVLSIKEQADKLDDILK